MSSVEELTKRIHRSERQTRIFKIVGITLGLLFIAGIFMGQYTVPNRIEAKEFVVVPNAAAGQRPDWAAVPMVENWSCIIQAAQLSLLMVIRQ
ncbi:hypothetical protein JXM67_07925 [candidate division WOR-3 bacterium]|nr:hypothetical protein [candidate division WOR-3 bacterium]